MILVKVSTNADGDIYTIWEDDATGLEFARDSIDFNTLVETRSIVERAAGKILWEVE